MKEGSKDRTRRRGDWVVFAFIALSQLLTIAFLTIGGFEYGRSIDERFSRVSKSACENRTAIAQEHNHLVDITNKRGVAISGLLAEIHRSPVVPADIVSAARRAERVYRSGDVVAVKVEIQTC